MEGDQHSPTTGAFACDFYVFKSFQKASVGGSRKELIFFVGGFPTKKTH